MKVFIVFVFAFILLLFGALAALAMQADAHEMQKAIESVIQANEGVLFVRMSRVDRGRIARAIVRYARKFALNPWLVLGVIRAESAGRITAENGSCVGLMQINAPIWGGHAFGDLYDADGNIAAGCHILRHYLNKYDGNTDKALLAYSGYSRKRGKAYLAKAKIFAEVAR